MRFNAQRGIPSTKSFALAFAAIIFVVPSCQRDVRQKESNDLLLTASPGDSLTLALSSLQRAFFSALTTDRKTAVDFVTPEFRTFDDSSSTFLDWETPKFLGHDTVTLRNLVMRIGPEHLVANRFEIAPYRDGSVAVIAFAQTTRPIITVWEKRSGKWKARGMRVNPPDSAVDWARTNPSRVVH